MLSMRRLRETTLLHVHIDRPPSGHVRMRTRQFCLSPLSYVHMRMRVVTAAGSRPDEYREFADYVAQLLASIVMR